MLPLRHVVLYLSMPVLALLNGAAVAEDHSRNSLDWNGTYSGVLPCADCPGIATRITLLKDGSFIRSVQYLERDARPRIDRGEFRWDAVGGTISLPAGDQRAQAYRVGENVLFHLDNAGRPITGPLAEDYQLIKHRTDARLEDREWELVELLGREFQPVGRQPRPSVRFDSELGRLGGTDGCNRIHAAYELLAPDRMRIGNVASTMMACPDMDSPQAFTRVLQKAGNYRIEDGELALFKGRTAVFARFREAGQ